MPKPSSAEPPATAIRPAAAADLDAVAAIESEQFSNPWRRDYYAAELGNSRCHFFVALPRPGGPVIGYLLFWRLGDELELHKIAVAAAWQRRGHAGRMMEFLISAGRGWGCGRVVLEVRAANLAAIRLYERHGFRLCGRRVDYYDRPREDALVFAFRF